MKDFKNYSLKEHNTFGIDAKCKRYLEFETDAEAIEVAEILRESRMPYIIIGGGSNLLLTKDFDGIVVRSGIKGYQFEESEVGSQEAEVRMTCGSGEVWDDMVAKSIEAGYYGMENLSLIPGDVGASAVQNIGAYGVEVKDVIHAVRGWRISTRSPFVLRNEDCHFGYRSSIFKTELKGDCIITDVIFRLSKKEAYNVSYKGLADELQKEDLPLSLPRVADAVIAVRNSKLPDIRHYGCAGSFFKNPIVEKEVFDALMLKFPGLISYPAGEGRVKMAAGQLIDLAGMKGVRDGDVGVWPKQALVIVNYGNATGQEVVAFYQKVQEKVMDRFGIRIEPEVNIV